MGRKIERPLEPHALTRGPARHFFGYYDKSPWDAGDRYILSGRVGFDGRMPEPDDVMTIGMIDTAEGDRFVELSETSAWCWQQGCMLQWLTPDCDTRIIHNDRDGERFVARIVDVNSGERRTLPRAIYQLDPHGRFGICVSFARLNIRRPGYGYAGGADPSFEDPCPREDGLWRMDLETGEAELLLSLEQAAALKPAESMRGARHWFNHAQFARDGARFSVLHRWSPEGSGQWTTRCLTIGADGADPHVLADEGFFSHYDWLGSDTVVGWCNAPGHAERGLFAFRDRTDEVERMGVGVLDYDGHNSFSPDRRWMLTDESYHAREQALQLYSMEEGNRYEIARLRTFRFDENPLRCDLHPRWNRAGDAVCVDSLNDGTRQMITFDVSSLVNGG